MNQKSFMVKIPFRLFNRTNGGFPFIYGQVWKKMLNNIALWLDDGSRHTYEVMNPVILTRDEALVTPVEGGGPNQSAQDKSQTNRLQTGLSSSHFNIQAMCQMQQRGEFTSVKTTKVG